MKLTFIGAAHEVTGSCHYIEACGKHILIDCGMEQGINVLENAPLPVDDAMIDYGVIGKLVEVESADGDVVEIYVE